MRKSIALFFAVTVLFASSGSAIERWELDFKPGPIKRHVVKTADGKHAVYYAMVAEVENKTKKDRVTDLFAVLKTNTKEEFRPVTNRYVLTRVRDRLTKEVVDDTPSLVMKQREWGEKEEKKYMPCSTLPLRLSPGAKRFVIFIFERIDQKADRFTIVFSGIGTVTDRKREKRKEYSIEYNRKGDEFHRRVTDSRTDKGVVWKYREISQ